MANKNALIDSIVAMDSNQIKQSTGTFTNIQTLDELISVLSSLREMHGGKLPVRVYTHSNGSYKMSVAKSVGVTSEYNEAMDKRQNVILVKYHH